MTDPIEIMARAYDAEYAAQLTSALEEQTISEFWLGYFREELRSEINDALLECFEASGLNKADIARKLDRQPEQITRWLSAPCNLETDTVSDLALALGPIPRVRFEKIEDMPLPPVAAANGGQDEA